VRGFGAVVPLGETVSIDLSLSLEAQWHGYRKNYRYEVRRLRQEGFTVYRDRECRLLLSFVALYTQTMRRVGAKDLYFFDEDYFLALRNALGESLQLIVAESEGEMRAAALFIHTCGIIQYHLSASETQRSSLSPSKLVLDEARLWGNEVGARWLHLGGGVGVRDDNLFAFKSGFSPVRHGFCIWSHIVLPEVYDELVQTRHARLEQQGRKPESCDYFPLYRAM
jgi:lipid II:glycine glycyltransferase (peptidoglycan interpeptide bridge formation enzyme)